ncbi:MAG TPA: hypothetical protein PKY81_16030 [bacterium]|nr:hypothetical protein [bacterium]
MTTENKTENENQVAQCSQERRITIIETIIKENLKSLPDDLKKIESLLNQNNMMLKYFKRETGRDMEALKNKVDKIDMRIAATEKEKLDKSAFNKFKDDEFCPLQKDVQNFKNLKLQLAGALAVVVIIWSFIQPLLQKAFNAIVRILG